jgi:hypothetical protein
MLPLFTLCHRHTVRRIPPGGAYARLSEEAQMSRLFVLTVIVIGLFAGSGAAQVAPPKATQVPVARDYQEVATAMAAAQATAIRPGDEALQCPALERELMATVNDPAMQAYTARAGAAYGFDVAALKKSGMTPQAAAALSASLAATGAMAPMAPVPSPVTPPTPAQQQAQAAQMLAMQQALATGQPLSPQQQQMMQQTMVAQQKIAAQQMAAVLPIMPQMMRTQRVMGLAAMKGCAWMTGGGVPLVPPVSAPVVPKR